MRSDGTTNLRSYPEIRATKKLLITPWAESFYQPFVFQTTSLNQQILRWFDYWLKGIDTGIMDEPEVAIYDNGTGEWRYENEYPLARTEWKKFYLRDKGEPGQKWGLLGEAPAKDKEGPSTYKNQSPPGQPQYAAFATPPLEADTRIQGPLAITLYASTTEQVLTDWSFFVKIGEIAPDGALLNPVTKQPQPKSFVITTDSTPPEVHLWSYGNLKAKFREIDEGRSRTGQPFHPFQNPADLKPDTVYEFQIELLPMFSTIKKGHRIWVQIAGEDAQHSTWDPSSLYVRGSMFGPVQPMKHTISIYHDPEHPSHLLLPVIPDAPQVAPVKAPLSEVLPGAPRFV